MKGEFDLDDLLDNLRQVKKLGSIRKILKFLPGNLKIDETKAEKADEKLKLFEILISSMTLEERKDPRLLKNASRKNRIIKGSGRTVQEYNLLINEFEQMRKRLKEFSSKTMKEQAVKNHNESKKYIKSKLYKKRSDFFNQFISENN